MKKVSVILALCVLLAAGVAYKYWGSGTEVKERQIIPEIVNITASQATVAWTDDSGGEYKGKVNYCGADGAAVTASEPAAVRGRHEVKLTGLERGSRYTYWVEGQTSRFGFQTQPAVSEPFSFLLIPKAAAGRSPSLVRSEMCDFIVFPGSGGGQGDLFKEVRPYVPVFGFDGAAGSYANNHGAGIVNSTVDWGGLRLVFVKDASGPMLEDSRRFHTAGVITSWATVSKGKASDIKDVNEVISGSKLHAQLRAFNEQNKAIALFAVITADTNRLVEVDSIKYLFIDEAGAGAVRFDADSESARAIFIADGREIVFKEPQLKQKRTCEECRRLADKGAYEQGIKAYEEFIANNNGSFQIDDAYFAIADIYDSKLFDFQKALEWYQKLKAEYPAGGFVAIADQRSRYIRMFGDFEFKPLAEFEKIKAVEFARKKDNPVEREKILSAVKGLVKQYPDCNLAPVMLNWAGNQYRLVEPLKAVEVYRQLREQYRDYDKNGDVLLQIAETYYEAGLYKQAKASYISARDEMPSLAGTVNPQIKRAERNIRRVHLSYASWAAIAMIMAGAFAGRRTRLNGRTVWAGVISFVVLSGILFFCGWIIHEQFASRWQIVSLVVSFSAAAAMSSVIGMLYRRKWERRPGAAFCMGSLAGLVLLAAGVYLSIYYIYEHYLIVFKL